MSARYVNIFLKKIMCFLFIAIWLVLIWSGSECLFLCLICIWTISWHMKSAFILKYIFVGMFDLYIDIIPWCESACHTQFFISPEQNKPKHHQHLNGWFIHQFIIYFLKNAIECFPLYFSQILWLQIEMNRVFGVSINMTFLV